MQTRRLVKQDDKFLPSQVTTTDVFVTSYLGGALNCPVETPWYLTIKSMPRVCMT